MDAEEWERRRQAHQETKERGWTTIREAREMEDDSIPVIISPSGKMTTPSGKKRPKTPSEEKLFMSPSKSKLPPVPEYHEDPIQELEKDRERAANIHVSTLKRPSTITSSQRHRDAVKDAQTQAYAKKLFEDAEKEEKRDAEREEKRDAEREEKRKKKELAAAARKGRRQGMTTKSKIKDTINYTTDRAKSKLRKIKSEKPAEIVDVELEAARKKGYDAHKKDQRARELVKAERQGRRQAMTFKSKVVEDTTNIAEKLEPVGKRVAKNVGKLLGEAKYTAKAAAKPHAKPTRIATTTTTAKPQAQRKTKPGPTVRKGTIGTRRGELGVKSKHGPENHRPDAKLHRSAKPLPTKSKHGPANNRTEGKLHRSAKPLPQNIPKTATVNKKRSVNFAMRKRSKK